MAISSLCNHPIKSHTELIPALGHKPKYGNTTLATFTQDGETAWKCTNKGCNVIGVHILYRLSKVTLNNTTVTYNAKAQKPSVTVTTRDGKKLLLLIIQFLIKTILILELLQSQLLLKMVIKQQQRKLSKLLHQR